MGRPVNLSYHRIEEVDDFDEVDEVESIEDYHADSWYVQVGAGDVKVLSREQVNDFYRLGIINAQTYVWQKGMQQWLPLSSFASQPTAPAVQASVTQEAASTSESDETWRVLMGPNDMRTLTLEQLDDFFRLGVIDEQTFVWQSGMKEWTRLSTLIGPEQDEPADEFWYALMGPGDIRTLSVEQLDDFYRLDVINEQTPLWQPGMAQWLPLGTVAGVEPSMSPASAPVASAVQPTAARNVASDVPLSLSIAAPEVARRSWLLRIAIAAGIVVTLVRNDVVYSAAQAASQRGQYIQAERRVLGGPLFGTPRAVESLITDSGGRIAAVRLPWIVTEMQEAGSAAKGEKSDNLGSVAKAQSPSMKAAPASMPAATPTDARADNASTATPDSKKATSVVAGALAGSKAKPSFSTVKPVSMPQVKKKRSSRGQSVFRADGKGDYYDPLNAAM